MDWSWIGHGLVVGWSWVGPGMIMRAVSVEAALTPRSSIGLPGLDMGVSWLGHGSVMGWSWPRHGQGGHGSFVMAWFMGDGSIR